MRPIKLNTLLMLLVIFTGSVAMSVSAVVALYQSNKEAQDQAAQIANSVKQQLEWQLLKAHNLMQGPTDFPDFFLWQNSNSSISGFCIQYETAEGRLERSLCKGDVSEEIWPAWFKTLYLYQFGTEQGSQRDVVFNEEVKGRINVTPSFLVMLHRAWRDMNNLMEMSVITVMTLCILLYITLGWVLKPVRLTTAALGKIQAGDLSVRLPDFRVKEWQDTAQSINAMASTLQETFEERKQLSMKLLHLQEEERRHLCRELHDELGQSLTGLRAIAYYMEGEAKDHCPSLLPKVSQITGIAQQMMGLVKNLLFKLRPADLDELGLMENLSSMIDEWNAKHQEVDCYLVTEGRCDEIPAAIAVNLLRIVQESLTNVVKHASASRVEVLLCCPYSEREQLLLQIEDNGNLTRAETLLKPGNGLLGVKERVNALNGEVNFARSALGGLKVEAIVPVLEYEVADGTH
ncbi:histidine kinase [Neptuniibacter sp. 2_MG-2023]|jgi:signal transduction histidine kinase|uniref:histidine kinase n=1 Tax=Neptuniibacter sp. 2_MG-2023 TaxID=3062671 RepID=UPI0026E2A740|nr:histidine kinase [Neptuniibacter sp. 2_MG-2023]MDO6514111.1 histidine kinase [Neptuniibacter sp. 2_MG-2023]